MSNFLKEFKEFACRGNVVDMAVGVTIGAAFGKVVTSFIEIFLNPILEKLTIEGGSEGIVGSLVRFAAVVVEFILIAFFLFLVVKAFNKMRDMTKKEEKPADPTTKVCPFCQSEISIKATRCPHCTSELKD